MEKTEKSRRLKSIFENVNLSSIRKRVDEYSSEYTTTEYEKMLFMVNLIGQDPDYISHFSEKDITLLHDVVSDVEEADIISEDEFLALTDSLFSPFELSSIDFYIITDNVLDAVSSALYFTFGTIDRQELMEIEWRNPRSVSSVLQDILEQLGVYEQSIQEARLSSFKRSIFESEKRTYTDVVQWVKSIDKKEADHIYRVLYSSKEAPRNSKDILLREVTTNRNSRIYDIFAEIQKTEESDEFSLKKINENLQVLSNHVKIESFRNLVYSKSPVMVAEGIDGSVYRIWGSLLENFEKIS